MGAAPGYKRLTSEQVRKLKMSEGNGIGSGVLAQLVDDALDVMLGELPSNIPQSQIANLVSDLGSKLTASQGAAVAALGALAVVGSTDGSGGAGDAALAVDVDSRISTLQAKIDELSASLRTASIILT